MIIIKNKFNFFRSSCLFFCISLLSLSFMFCLSVEAQRDEGTVAGIWTFDDGTATDSSNQKLNGVLVGKPEQVKGIVNDALRFNGESDGIRIPDSNRINTGGPFPNKTIAAFFNCDDVNKNHKQVIFEEGGRTRGLVVYVFDGKIYGGAWNRAEAINWQGAWISTDIKSKTWYHVAIVIRNGANAVQKDKLEFWLDSKLIKTADGGQLHAHGDDNGIGFVNQNAVYHDNGGDGSNIDYFGGMLDEMVVYASAFAKADIEELVNALDVAPQGKLTTTWGKLKTDKW